MKKIATIVLLLVMAGGLAQELTNDAGTAQARTFEQVVDAWLAGTATRADVKQVLIEEYKAGTMTRERLKTAIIDAYKAGKLTRDDLKWLIIHMYQAGELKREDLRWLLVNAYKEGKLTRDDLKWLIFHAYYVGELTRDDIHWLVIKAYKTGELTWPDVKWLLLEAKKAGELRADDIRWLLLMAYKAGDLSKTEVEEVVTEGTTSGSITTTELTAEDIVSTQAVETTSTTTVAVPAELTTIEATTPTTGGEAGQVQPVAVEAQPVEITPTTTATQVMEQVSGEVQDPQQVVEQEVSESAKDSCDVGQYTLAVEKSVIGMKGVIDYVGTELKLDTAELEAIKNDLYNTLVDTTAGGQTPSTTGDIVDKAKGLMEEFKQKATSLEGFNKAKAEEYIQKALTDNTDYLNGIETERNKACAAIVLKRFDVFIENTAKVLKEMEEAGTDAQIIANLKYKLDTLIKMRSDLQEALDANDRTKFLAVENAFRDLMNELRLKGTAVQVVAREVFGNEVSRLAMYRAIVAKAERRVEELASSGVDMTDVKQKLAGVSAKLDEAEAALKETKTKWAEKDYSAAKDANERARKLLDEAKELYSNIRLDVKEKIQASVCGDVATVVANAETEVQTANKALTDLANNSNVDTADLSEPIADLKRLQEILVEAKKAKESGNTQEVCALLQKAREIHANLKDAVKDYRKVAAGQAIASTTQIAEVATAVSAGGAAEPVPTSAASTAVMRTIAERPAVLREFCDKEPQKCTELLKNNPVIARIVKEKASDVVENLINSGAASTTEIAKIYNVRAEVIKENLAQQTAKVEESKNIVRAKIAEGTASGQAITTAVKAEQVSEAVKTRIERLGVIDKVLDRIKARNIRITLKCRNAVKSAIEAGVTDEEKLVEICKQGVFGGAVSETGAESSAGSAAGSAVETGTEGTS